MPNTSLPYHPWRFKLLGWFLVSVFWLGFNLIGVWKAIGTHKDTDTHTHTHTPTHTYPHTHTPTHTQTYTRTHTHTPTHTYAKGWLLFWSYKGMFIEIWFELYNLS